MQKLIYMDHAATTQMEPEVLEAMQPYLFSKYGNPSTLYDLGEFSRAGIEQARTQVAELVEAAPGEIFFTSGGSEADNWALKMAAYTYQGKGKHIITSKIEHHAVLNSCLALEKEGFEVTYLNVDEGGRIRISELLDAIKPTTILISIMYANNEIGTIQPIEEIAQIAKEHHILFHTDAVQAYGQIPISVKENAIDMLSASAHKLYGPKGVGMLYIREGVQLKPFLNGGEQERGKRAGTENVPGIVGFGAAAKIAKDGMDTCMEREQKLRDDLIKIVLREIPYTRLNGYWENRLPNNASFCFQFLEGSSLSVLLDMKGICASAASACSSGNGKPSHVLLALGIPPEMAYGSIRLTLGKETTKEDVQQVAEALKESVRELREKSSEYQQWHN